MGSHRKAYIIVNGIISIFALWLLSLHFTASTIEGGPGMNAYYVTALLTINSLNASFFNVVVNALMVA